jgi:hypothetical protein
VLLGQLVTQLLRTRDGVIPLRCGGSRLGDDAVQPLQRSITRLLQRLYVRGSFFQLRLNTLGISNGTVMCSRQFLASQLECVAPGNDGIVSGPRDDGGR